MIIIITAEQIGMTGEVVRCGAGAQVHGGLKTIAERLELRDWLHCDINENSLGHRRRAVINY